MLGGALMSYAPLRGFQIEPPAGDFFAGRAVGNINESEKTDEDRFSAAVTGASYSSTSRVRRMRYCRPAAGAAAPIAAPLLGVKVSSANTDDGSGKRS